MTAILERNETPTPLPQPPSIVGDFRQWLLERGVLAVLIGTPIVAIIGGIFYRVMPYPFLLCAVLAAFVILPIWTTWRRRVSTNPAEPAHHLNKYALWALPAAAMFSVVRIPLHFMIGIIYWHPWYDFGNALTNTPLDSQSTLLVGGLLNLIQGWAMGLGFYILFKRFSLMNVLCYIAVWISALYSYDFAAYSRVGLQSPPYWHASMAWAHFGMAITLWFMPNVVAKRFWPRFGMPGRVGVIAVGALIVLIPSVFAQWRAVTWQFPKEAAIDNAAFARANLALVPGSATLLSTTTDTRYSFTLRMGPRDYHNWFKQQRSLDAHGIQVTGQLSRNGQIIAWCNASVADLPSANFVTLPEKFAPVMKAVTYSNIPVTCRGPAATGQATAGSSRIDVNWSAHMTLVGGQEVRDRTFTGQQSSVQLNGS
ncbi:MAG TPA: hypothetical protein VEO01_23205 [Pseudonocardiaceae bacterium]|nr:hypothetical protein [Pseudonocardiaceae bacterium]